MAKLSEKYKDISDPENVHVYEWRTSTQHLLAEKDGEGDSRAWRIYTLSDTSCTYVRNVQLPPLTKPSCDTITIAFEKSEGVN